MSERPSVWLAFLPDHRPRLAWLATLPDPGERAHAARRRRARTVSAPHPLSRALHRMKDA